MSDPIDRKMEITAISFLPDGWQGEAVHALLSLPQAQPGPGWIPVRERLPLLSEEGYSDLVLVSFENANFVCILEYRKHEGDGDWYDEIGDKGVSEVGLIVNAWMPLPEQYREEEDMKANK